MSLIPSFCGRCSSIFGPFSLEVWDPFDGSPSSSSSSSSTFLGEISFAHTMSMDWKENSKAHVIKVDLPGLKKEEVKVEVEDGNILQISGKTNREKDEKTDTWHHVERSSGKFLWKLRLPENAEANHVAASMENGVLTMTVPKLEVKKPNVRSIEISE